MSWGTEYSKQQRFQVLSLSLSHLKIIHAIFKSFSVGDGEEFQGMT